MTIGRVLTVLSLVAVLLSGSPASAGDNEYSRKTLKGLTGVEVGVEYFSDAAKRAGFDRRTFQRDVELKLRMAGIKVLDRESALGTPGDPFLRVVVTVMHQRPNEIAASSMHMLFSQEVLLKRDPSLPVSVADTWSVGSVAYGDISYIRDGVKDLTDQFINAWLSVNPKK